MLGVSTQVLWSQAEVTEEVGVGRLPGGTGTQSLGLGGRPAVPVTLGVRLGMSPGESPGKA